MSSAAAGLLAGVSAVIVTTLLAIALVIRNVEFDLPVFVDGGSGHFLPLALGLVLGLPIIVGVVVWVSSAVGRRRARVKVTP